MDSDVLVAPARSLRRLPSGYRPGGTLALVLRGGCLVSTVLVGIALPALFSVHRSLGNGLGLTEARTRVADVTTLIGAIGLVTGVAFVMWLRRIYRNLRALGVRWMRLSPGWAVWAWFVPGFNLIAPKRMLDDIWRATGLEAPHPIGDRWRRGPVPWWLHAWWVLFVGAAALLIAGAWIDSGLDDRGAVLMLVLAAALSLVVLPAAVLVIGGVTRRQEARARYLELEQPEPRHRPRVERRVLAVVVGVAAAVGTYGMAVWPAVATDAKATGIGSGFEAFGVAVVYPHRFSAVAAQGTEHDTGTVLVGNRDGTEQITLLWSSPGSPTEDLFVLVDGVIISLPSSSGATMYRGRPVSLIVDGQPAVLENFSVGTDSDMSYGTVMAATCSGSARVVTMIVIVETTRGIRNALSNAVAPSITC